MRLITFTTLIAGLLAVALPSAARAEAPTPQAIDAHAEFLVGMPPPPTPGTVCVVDTGVDLSTDVAPAVAARYALDGGTPDDVGATGIPKHGTFVAGAIASQLDGRDSVGIWPQARIVSVRVFAPDNGGTSVAAYLKGLAKCREAGATVINLSLSGLDQATGTELGELQNAIVDLRSNGGINVVAAAGNNGGPVGYPARFPEAFAVGASDAAGQFCSFSSRGDFLDISAFGCGLTLSWPGGGTAIGEGTSLSTPVVSALLAAVRAYNPDLGVRAAEALLTSTARTSSAGKAVDAEAAFRAAGLGPSVDAAKVRAAASFAPSPTAATPAGSAIAIPSEQAPTSTDPFVGLGVHKARLRSATFRHGVLVVSVSGVPDFGRAIFTVDHRRVIRPSGVLRLRLKRAPKHISVVVDVPHVGRTAALTVKLKKTPTRRR